MTETVTKTQPYEQPSQVEGSWRGGGMPAHSMGQAIDEVASGRMDTLTLQNKCGKMMRWWVHPITIYGISGAISGSVLSVHLSRWKKDGSLSVSWREDGWTL